MRYTLKDPHSSRTMKVSFPDGYTPTSEDVDRLVTQHFTVNPGSVFAPAPSITGNLADVNSLPGLNPPVSQAEALRRSQEYADYQARQAGYIGNAPRQTTASTNGARSVPGWWGPGGGGYADYAEGNPAGNNAFADEFGRTSEDVTNPAFVAGQMKAVGPGAMAAAGRGALMNTIPTIAAITGGGLSAAAGGPAAPVTGLVGGLASGVGASYLQDKALHAVLGDDAYNKWQEQLAKDREEYFIQSELGSIAPFGAVGKPSQTLGQAAGGFGLGYGLNIGQQAVANLGAEVSGGQTHPINYGLGAAENNPIVSGIGMSVFNGGHTPIGEFAGKPGGMLGKFLTERAATKQAGGLGGGIDSPVSVPPPNPRQQNLTPAAPFLGDIPEVAPDFSGYAGEPTVPDLNDIHPAGPQPIPETTAPDMRDLSFWQDYRRRVNPGYAGQPAVPDVGGSVGGNPSIPNFHAPDLGGDVVPPQSTPGFWESVQNRMPAPEGPVEASASPAQATGAAGGGNVPEQPGMTARFEYNTRAGDPLLPDALRSVVVNKNATVLGLRRTLGISADRAKSLMQALEEGGAVSKPDKSGRRKILITQGEQASGTEETPSGVGRQVQSPTIEGGERGQVPGSGGGDSSVSGTEAIRSGENGADVSGGPQAERKVADALLAQLPTGLQENAQSTAPQREPGSLGANPEISANEAGAQAQTPLPGVAQETGGVEPPRFQEGEGNQPSEITQTSRAPDVVAQNAGELSKAFQTPKEQEGFGYAPEEADHIASRYETIAKHAAAREGITPQEWWDRNFIKIVNGGEAEAKRLAADMEATNGPLSKAMMHREDMARYVITALSNPDRSSALHELGHIVRDTLTKEELNVVGKYLGADLNPDGSFDFSAGSRGDERFAKVVEQMEVARMSGQENLQAFLKKLPAPLRSIGGMVYQIYQGLGKSLSRMKPGETVINPQVENIIRARFGEAGKDTPLSVKAQKAADAILSKISPDYGRKLEGAGFERIGSGIADPAKHLAAYAKYAAAEAATRGGEWDKADFDKEVGGRFGPEVEPFLGLMYNEARKQYEQHWQPGIGKPWTDGEGLGGTPDDNGVGPNRAGAGGPGDMEQGTGETAANPPGVGIGTEGERVGGTNPPLARDNRNGGDTGTPEQVNGGQGTETQGDGRPAKTGEGQGPVPGSTEAQAKPVDTSKPIESTAKNLIASMKMDDIEKEAAGHGAPLPNRKSMENTWEGDRLDAEQNFDRYAAEISEMDPKKRPNLTRPQRYVVATLSKAASLHLDALNQELFKNLPPDEAEQIKNERDAVMAQYMTLSELGWKGSSEKGRDLNYTNALNKFWEGKDLNPANLRRFIEQSITNPSKELLEKVATQTSEAIAKLDRLKKEITSQDKGVREGDSEPARKKREKSPLEQKSSIPPEVLQEIQQRLRPTPKFQTPEPAPTGESVRGKRFQTGDRTQRQDDLFTAGKHLAEVGLRQPSTWAEAMRSHFAPDATDRELAQAWHEVKKDRLAAAAAEAKKNPDKRERDALAKVFADYGREQRKIEADAVRQSGEADLQKIEAFFPEAAPRGKSESEQRAYAEDARKLAAFAKRIKNTVGDAAPEEALQDAFQKAVDDFRAKRPLEEIKKELAGSIAGATDPEVAGALLAAKKAAAQARGKTPAADKDAVSKLFADLQKKAAQVDALNKAADKSLGDMEAYFPKATSTAVPKESLAPVALKEYADGAKDLATFARKMKGVFGESVGEDAMKNAFTQATADYKAKMKPIEDIKRELAQTITDAVSENESPLMKGILAVQAGIVSNPYTILVTNTLSHASRQMAEQVARVPAAVVDIARMYASRASGDEARWGPPTRTVGNLNLAHDFDAFYNGAIKQGLPDAVKLMKGERPENDPFAANSFWENLGVHKKLGSSNTILNAYFHTVYASHEATYRPFRIMALRRALTEMSILQAQREAYEAKKAGTTPVDVKARALDLRTSPPEEMQAYAVSYANEMVYLSDNPVSTLTEKVSNATENVLGKHLTAALRTLLIPVQRVPSNAALAQLEGVTGVPRAVFGAFRRTLQKTMTPEQSRRLALTFGRGVVGPGLIALGSVLAKNGILTGHTLGKDEYLKREKEGAPAQSFFADGRWYDTQKTYFWDMMTLGADLYEKNEEALAKSGKTSDTPRGSDIVAATADTLHRSIHEMPVVNLPEKMAEYQSNGWGTLGQFGAELVPAAVNFAGAMLDPYKRKVPYNQGWDTTSATFQRRIPGWRQQLPPRSVGDVPIPEAKPYQGNPLNPMTMLGYKSVPGVPKPVKQLEGVR